MFHNCETAPSILVKTDVMTYRETTGPRGKMHDFKSETLHVFVGVCGISINCLETGSLASTPGNNTKVGSSK